jgi:hypothetical protein
LLWRAALTGARSAHAQFLPRPALSLAFHAKPGFDIAFAQDAIPPYRDKDFLDAHRWTPRTHKQDFGKYKYLMSLDGHTASWGLIERLATGSLVFVQASPYREHYYKLLEPMKHFVPIDRGFANLQAARDWAVQNDDEARKIATQMHDLMRTRMRLEDTWCYMFRLVSELSRRVHASELQAEDGLLWVEIDEADVVG